MTAPFDAAKLRELAAQIASAISDAATLANVEPKDEHACVAIWGQFSDDPAFHRYPLQDPAKPEPPEASNVSASPPSVEALEAERAMVEEIERLQRVLLAAEVGRDQANKERDEAWQAILRIYRTPVYEERGKPASGISVALIRAINDAAALALAGVPGGQLIATDEADTVTEGSVSPGVPGGGQQEQDLGGDRGRSPVVKTEREEDNGS